MPLAASGALDQGGLGMADLVNATKGQALNTGALVQAFNTLSTAIQNQVTASLAAAGYYQFNNGLILQWGTGSTTTGAGTITYPKAFPNACFIVMLTNTGTGAATNNNLIASTTPGKTTCAVYGAAAQSLTFFYLAIGN